MFSWLVSGQINNDNLIRFINVNQDVIEINNDKNMEFSYQCRVVILLEAFRYMRKAE